MHPQTASQQRGPRLDPDTSLSDLRRQARGGVIKDRDDRLPAPPCSEVTLAANTKHWIVFSSEDGFGGAREIPGPLPHEWYLVRESDSHNEDGGVQSGWSIGNSIFGRTHTGFDLANWTADSTSPTQPVAVRIYAIRILCRVSPGSRRREGDLRSHLVPKCKVLSGPFTGESIQSDHHAAPDCRSMRLTSARPDRPPSLEHP